MASLYNTDDISPNSSFSGESSSDGENQTEVAPYQFEPLAREIANLQPESVQESDQRMGNSDWCTCNFCLHMSTERECKCCEEVDCIKEKIDAFNDDGGGIACITQHPGFEAVCLNRRNRYVAYRQLVRWCWGYLGKEVRVVIPSCVVVKIRQEFPSQQYTGFTSPS